MPAAHEFSASQSDESLVGRATDLVPLIREHAQQGTEDRRVTPEVIQALQEAGFFRMLVPRRYGGLETNMRTLMEVVAEVARGDGSTGWALALLAIDTWFAALYPEQAQDEVFGANPEAKLCGCFSAPTRSDRVEGGYIVSGRWPYASGSFAADWAILGMGMAVPEGGDPRALALIPATDWTIEPSWFVAGMQGTGSDTIVVKDQFVPEHRVQGFADLVEGRYATPHRGKEAISSMAFIPVAALELVAPQLGLGRHAMELTLERLPRKNVAYTIYTEARNSPAHQIQVAEAATKLDLAELLMQRAAYDIDTAAARGDVLDVRLRARVRNDTGAIAELVKEGLDLLMSVNGASSFADANLLSRIWRDAEIAGRHSHVLSGIGKEVYGRLLLGTEGAIPHEV